VKYCKLTKQYRWSNGLISWQRRRIDVDEAASIDRCCARLPNVANLFQRRLPKRAGLLLHFITKAILLIIIIISVFRSWSDSDKRRFADALFDVGSPNWEVILSCRFCLPTCMLTTLYFFFFLQIKALKTKINQIRTPKEMYDMARYVLQTCEEAVVSDDDKKLMREISVEFYNAVSFCCAKVEVLV
jgi:hypothetical protein